MTDKEITSASIEVDHILPAREQDTVGGYRERIVDRLFSGMLSARFSELAQKPDAPFLAAGAGRGLFLARTKEQASLSARVREDGIERGLEGLLGEAERVARFGFTATELERQKQSVLRSYERVVAEVDNIVSASRADEYVRNFTQNETLPSPNDEYAMHQRFLPQITLDEVNRVAREWFPDQNRLIIVSAPEKAGLVVPDEQKLAAVVKAASSRALTAYVDTVSAAALLDAVPQPGKIARTTTIDAAGITEWQLSNGVKVVLKPTSFKEDEVIFRATSPGGTSLASDRDFIPASTATQVISAGGLGRFNTIDMRKILTGKAATVNPFIGELEEGLNGGGSRKDLETLFQLIYLRFTQPRRDETAFAAQTAQMKSLLANQSASPDYALASTLAAAMYQNHVRRRPQTLEALNEWNLDKSLAFYKDRFADASDFTFVFVGSFDLATMKPLVERYLATLPSIRRKETWKDVGVRPTAGHRREDGGERDRAQEPGRDHVHRTVRVRRSAPPDDPGDGAHAARQPAAGDPRGSRRHLQHHGQSDYSADSAAGVSLRHPLRLRSAAHRRSAQAGVSGDRAIQAERPLRATGQRREGGAAARIRDQQHSRTTSCSARLWPSIKSGKTSGASGTRPSCTGS